MVWVGKMQSSKLTQESETMLRKAFLCLFFLWGIQTPGEDEKMWLLTWWFGLHGTFPGNRCCSLCTGTTVTGKLTQEVQSLKRNEIGWIQSTVLLLRVWEAIYSKVLLLKLLLCFSSFLGESAALTGERCWTRARRDGGRKSCPPSSQNLRGSRKGSEPEIKWNILIE